MQLSNNAGRRVGPHRVFNSQMTAPGLAMSRSLGDAYAHSLGVSAKPTCHVHRLRSADQFVVSSAMLPLCLQLKATPCAVPLDSVVWCNLSTPAA